MNMTFRHYGPADPVTLEKIAQIPVISGIVSAVYGIPPGGVWPREDIAAIKSAAAAHDLTFEVVESVPVSEDIKLGSPRAARHIENYCENLRRLGEAGVRCVCYNFMPVFDWLRSDLRLSAPDGSNSLAYSDDAVRAMDRSAGTLSLPGWDESYAPAELRGLLDAYKPVDEEKLWDNLAVFLRAVIPAAERAGINMAIHPDDPPWGIFGLPRIITDEPALARLLDTVDRPANGLTFCTGSLGASEDNDLIKMAGKFGGRIHFAHLRNIKRTAPRDFHECAHPAECGSLDLPGIIRALKKSGFDRYIRPDHGRMIWGEEGRPGYGLYDRALGAMYLYGLWEGC